MHGLCFSRWRWSVFALLLLGAAETAWATETPPPETRPGYASPQEVYEAMFKAEAQRDWRAYYSCFSPQYQKELVFSAWFGCLENLNEQKATAFVEPFLIADGMLHLETEYIARYKEKHGIDLTEIQEQREQARAEYLRNLPADEQRDPAAPHPPIPPEASGPPEPPTDERILVDVFYEVIADKPGFFVATYGLFYGEEAPADEQPEPRPLRKLRIEGDRAQAEGDFRIHGSSTMPGEETKKFVKIVDSPYEFLKTPAGWLIDGPSDIDDAPAAEAVPPVQVPPVQVPARKAGP